MIYTHWVEIITTLETIEMIKKWAKSIQHIFKLINYHEYE